MPKLESSAQDGQECPAFTREWQHPPHPQVTGGQHVLLLQEADDMSASLLVAVHV